MRDSVRRAFVGFTMPLEGLVPFMYLDVKGLVTVAIGNLIDPIQFAMPLPFVRADGSYAQRDEIAAEWLAVKARQDLASHGGMAFKDITTLRLPKEGIDRVVFSKLDQSDRHIAGRFADYPKWPADAQLAVLSLAWACGPAFRFPMLESALRARNFDMAAVECQMDTTGNLGIIPRNNADRALFQNAARVERDGMDPEVLWYPRTPSVVPPDDDTQPEIVCDDEPPEAA